MPQVITTILLDDNPKGLRLIEMANWSGKSFVVPRAKLKDFKTRADSKQPGVYILLGEGDEKPKVYIGQSENVLDRLYSHDSNREEDEWNLGIIFVGNLDSTSIKHLESLSLEVATTAERYQILNNVTPRANSISEAQKIVIKEYFEKMKVIVGLLGYNLFDSIDESIADISIYYLKAEGADARAQLLDDGSLNVLKGSLARKRETRAFVGWSKTARNKFIEDGILIDNKDDVSYLFTEDIVFSSPSAAAATVTGRPINGWTSWKDEKGNTLDKNIRGDIDK